MTTNFSARAETTDDELATNHESIAVDERHRKIGSALSATKFHCIQPVDATT